MRTMSYTESPARYTEEHRLVHKVGDGEVRIAACRYH